MAKDSVSLEFITKADCICLGLNCNKLTSYKFIFGLKPFNRTKIFIAVPASCQLDVTQQNRNHVVISEWVSVTNRLSCPQIQIKKVLQDTMEHNCCDIHWIAFCWCNPTKISSNWYELPLKTGFEKLKMLISSCD